MGIYKKKIQFGEVKCAKISRYVYFGKKQLSLEKII